MLRALCVCVAFCLCVTAAPALDTQTERHKLGKNLGLLPNGRQVCEGGVWTECTEEEINDLRVNPDVQCWRDPPCLHMLNYATPEKCALWPDDDDWPTWDPHHAPRPGRKTFADAVWHFLVNKTVVIVGDSVGAQVYLAAVCEAARGGLDPLEAKGNTFDFVTRGDEKAPRVPLPEHLAARMRALRRLVIAAPVETWIGGPPQPPHVLRETGTLLVRKGWHWWGRDDMQRLLRFADVLIVNYGLHYILEERPAPGGGGGREPGTGYPGALREMLEQAAAFAREPGKAFLFRETGEEHGSDPGAMRREGRCSCVPKPRGTYSEAVKRNEAAKAVLREFPDVPVVPFYNLSWAAFDLHEGSWGAWDMMREREEALARGEPPGEEWEGRRGGMTCDCTHWCYTPQILRFSSCSTRAMWLPLPHQFWGQFYDDVYLALERAPGLRKEAAGSAGRRS